MSANLSKYPKYKLAQKSIPWEWHRCMLTDRHAKATCRFLHAKAPKNCFKRRVVGHTILLESINFPSHFENKLKSIPSIWISRKVEAVLHTRSKINLSVTDSSTKFHKISCVIYEVTTWIRSTALNARVPNVPFVKVKQDMGVRRSAVEALRYKSEGRGLHSRFGL